MAILKVVTLPDPRLKKVSAPVTVFDDSLRSFIKDMFDTMVAENGIGLAAVQVGNHQRIVILDLGDLDMDSDYIEGDEASEKTLASKKKVSKIEVYINPQIIESEGGIEYEEGCLSVPGVRSLVQRKERLKVKFQNEFGKWQDVETHGLRSIALQHEIDHCDGIVFTDRLGPMQRMMILAKYKKLREKEEAEEKEPV